MSVQHKPRRCRVVGREEVWESRIVWCNIGEAEAEAWELSGIDGLYGGLSANGTGREKLAIGVEASTETDIGHEVNDDPRELW